MYMPPNEGFLRATAANCSSIVRPFATAGRSSAAPSTGPGLVTASAPAAAIVSNTIPVLRAPFVMRTPERHRRLDNPAPERKPTRHQPASAFARVNAPARPRRALACSGLGGVSRGAKVALGQPAAALEGAALLLGGWGRSRPKSS